MTEHLDLLRTWEQTLRERGALSDADQLRDAVLDPNLADAESCWEVMWSKPLYANTRVDIGERKRIAIAPQMAGSWQFIGADDERFVITHQGGRNAAENFSIHGVLAHNLRTTHKIAAHRLFAIQGAAIFLRRLADRAGVNAPFASVAQEPLAKVVPELRQQLGREWGPITVLHMLTDLGLAVKPDLHLVRTVRRLGLLPGLDEMKVPNEEIAIRINEAVAQLATDYGGSSSRAANLRYMDKLLMEVSRQGLLLEAG